MDTPASLPVNTPVPVVSVVDELNAVLLPEVDVGTDWSRLPADPRVSRVQGDDTSLRSPCDLRGPVAVTSAAGEHLAGPKGSADLARPQWYETVALFSSARAAQDYMQLVRSECTSRGESIERLFDQVGDATVYVQYGATTQIHRVLIVRRRNVLMQIRYDTYALSDSDEHRFEGLARAADDRASVLPNSLPDFGASPTPTPRLSRLN